MVTPLRLHFTGRDSGKQCSSWRTSTHTKLHVCTRGREEEEGGVEEEGDRERIWMECIPHYASRQNSTSTFTGNEGNGEQVGSRVSSLRDSPWERESCADVCSEKCLVVASYQDKLILMPDTVVDVCTQAWISATDDYLSRDNGTMGCTACVLHDA